MVIICSYKRKELYYHDLDGYAERDQIMLCTLIWMQGKITYFDNFFISEYCKTNVEIEHFIKGDRYL